MKPPIASFWKVSALFLATLLGNLSPARGNNATTVAEALPGGLQSVFNPQPGVGKDPFFPNSTRLRPVAPVPAHNSATLITGVPDSIFLKGLAVLNQRKLAIINNCTVEAGEDFTTRINGHLFKVTCVEIGTN